MRPTEVLEGDDIQPSPPAPVLGDDAAIKKHALFLGAIGSGKTHGITHYIRGLHFTADDVLVFFDTKGDFLLEFGSAFGQCAVLGPGGNATWNVFADLISDDAFDRADQVHEIAAAIFSEASENAGQNAFFASAAQEVFGGVLLAMSEEGAECSNADLRKVLDSQIDVLSTKLDGGTKRYLANETTGQSVLAFLQQTVNAVFSGIFRQQGNFSVRDFVQSKGGRALFIEYDMAIGARLLPAYRVLIDLAIKEALEIGRRPGNTGRVFFVLDEFALLPKLAHIADGINFGRGLGLRFIAGCQNVSQVLGAYGPESGSSILSGFGTIFAFRLMDAASRDLVRQRSGANRKQITVRSLVRTAPDRPEIVSGNVVEDWDLSRLLVGQCIVSPPIGPPFRFTFPQLQRQPWPGRPQRFDQYMRHLLDDQARGNHLDGVVTPAGHGRPCLSRSYREHHPDQYRQQSLQCLKYRSRPPPQHARIVVALPFTCGLRVFGDGCPERVGQRAHLVAQILQPDLSDAVQIALRRGKVAPGDALDRDAGVIDQRCGRMPRQASPGQCVSEPVVEEREVILAPDHHDLSEGRRAQLHPVGTGQPAHQQPACLLTGIGEQSVLIGGGQRAVFRGLADRLGHAYVYPRDLLGRHGRGGNHSVHDLSAEHLVHQDCAKTVKPATCSVNPCIDSS